MENFDFSKSTENALKMILRHKWGILGENQRYSVFLKWDNTKTKNSHVPPPLNWMDFSPVLDIEIKISFNVGYIG